MLRSLGEKLDHLKPQSKSVRNILKLAGGTAGSQAITVAVSPILTRLYVPESFGILATFMSILALLRVVSSLSYELAIAVPEDDEEAIAVVWLCIVLVIISTVVTVLVVFFAGSQLAGLLREPSLKPMLWLLPVSVLAIGVYSPLSYWAIRRKQFGLLAKTRFEQSIFGVLASLLAAPLGTIGLLLGQVLSQGCGFLSILRQSGGLLFANFNNPLYRFKNFIFRYKKFGIYSTLARLINLVGSEVPNFLFVSAFGATDLGYLALAQRLLLLPAGLIGNSVAQVFLGQASEKHRSGLLRSYVLQIGFRLLFVGTLVSILVCYGIAPLVPFVFGEQWINVKILFPILVPLFIGQIVVSPLSMAFIVSENNRIEIFAQIGQALPRIIALISSIKLGASFDQSLLSYSIGSLVGYTLYACVLIAALPRLQSYASDRV